ncbi:MAG: hypothetical protein H5T84_10295, partial [Thermoleophilia bacterium]|nr:hypothetical protein [Thermoleophilia bacterium]
TTSAEVALVAATTKTVLGLNAPANQSVAIFGASITFDGTSNTAEPVSIQLLRHTTAGTSTARNPLKTKDTSTALQTTGGENYSAEPTAGDILRTWHVHPQAGAIVPLLLEREIVVPGGGRVSLRCTAPAGVNCLATIDGEE